MLILPWHCQNITSESPDMSHIDITWPETERAYLYPESCFQKQENISKILHGKATFISTWSELGHVLDEREIELQYLTQINQNFSLKVGIGLSNSLLVNVSQLAHPGKQIKILVYNVCQFMWCKYIHHCDFQTTNVTLLDMDFGGMCSITPLYIPTKQTEQTCIILRAQVIVK